MFKKESKLKPLTEIEGDEIDLSSLYYDSNNESADEKDMEGNKMLSLSGSQIAVDSTKLSSKSIGGSRERRSSNATSLLKKSKNQFEPTQRPANRNDINLVSQLLDEILKSRASRVNVKSRYSFLSDNDFRKDNGWKRRIFNAYLINYACEGATAEMVELLTVGSAEMGNLLRKVRRIEAKGIEEMTIGMNLLFDWLSMTEKELKASEETVAVQAEKMKTLEIDVLQQCHERIAELEQASRDESLKAKQSKRETEIITHELNLQIQSLNKQLDMERLRYSLLENEKASVSQILDKVTNAYQTLQDDMNNRLDEIDTLHRGMGQRNIVLADLLEKEAVRNAEIKKLTNLTVIEGSPEDTDTTKLEVKSVFCIRCKAQLEDLSSIEDAVFGRGAKNANRLYCEAFRLLLSMDPAVTAMPVRKPDSWIRQTMRDIFEARVNNEVYVNRLTSAISQFTSDTEFLHVEEVVFSNCSGRFYQFVYHYFDELKPSADENTAAEGQQTNQGTAAAADPKQIKQLGEWRQADRFSFYMGVRAMVMASDSEAALFWTLMSDCFGQDGTEFVFYCLRVLRSQLPADHAVQYLDQIQKKDIFVSLASAEKATTAIMSRAALFDLEELLTTIAAMGADVEVERIVSRPNSKASSRPQSRSRSRPQSTQSGSRPHSRQQQQQSTSTSTPTAKGPRETYAGISLFVWLRIMLRQFQGDQIQRVATFQIMLDTVMRDRKFMPSYPQFAALGRSLFSSLITESEIMEWYIECCEQRRGQRVTADIISKVAEYKGFFVRSFHHSLSAPFQLTLDKH